MRRYPNGLQDIMDSIDSGIPLIAAQARRHDDPTAHYRLVTGYDILNNIIIFDDPELGPEIEVFCSVFEALWHTQGQDHVALKISRERH